MHRPLAIALALSLSASVALAQLPADMPKRQAGLWEMKTVVAEMGGMALTMQTCIDDSIEDLLAKQQDQNEQCEKQTYRKDGNRFLFDAVCRIDTSTAHTSGVFTGDFTRNYQGQINTTYSPPLQGMATSSMKVEARWLSACKPGQKPGDVIMTGMPGMGSINIEEMLKNMPQAPR